MANRDTHPLALRALAHFDSLFPEGRLDQPNFDRIEPSHKPFETKLSAGHVTHHDMLRSQAEISTLKPGSSGRSLFPDLCPVRAAVEQLANAESEERGAVYTRREVVDFILDLSGYTAGRPLLESRLLEPSFGEGDFLLPAIERLLAAWRNAGAPEPLKHLSEAIRGVEIHRASFERTYGKVVDLLAKEGLSAMVAETLADRWLIQDDFLLCDFSNEFDFVVGNPPYVRQELIPPVLLSEYRARYQTMFDRSDIYIPFLEKSIVLLTETGNCGFICSDRWMKNRYGGPLRALVANHFHLKAYVDMVDTPAFHADVVAYPAITIISRIKGASTRVAHRPTIGPEALSCLALQMTRQESPEPSSPVKELQGIADDARPWVLDSSSAIALVRRLESEFPSIEEADCKVGIGVATGADKAFIGRWDELDVEDCRKLPLVMTRDIEAGRVEWRGLGVINPFGEDGRLVELAAFPKLSRYLEARRDLIARRHVARKSPTSWFRTIDRIYPELAATEKLLIPDIKGNAHIVYEAGHFYPHHNLYYITSREWSIRALEAVLLSGIARLFVSVYSTHMRGGYLRFQAQYLRRIRIPHWNQVPTWLQENLIVAAEGRDISACNRAVISLYGLSEVEQTALSD